MATSKDKLDAAHIRQIVAGRYTKKRWAVHFEVGLCKHGRLRADVIATNMGAWVEIIEVKSSVADFRSDKKWEGYRKFCDRLWFAMAAPVYAKVKDDIPKGIGVYVVGPNSIKVVQKSRIKEMDGKLRLNIMARMAYRSADATLHQRKSKHAGRKYVARKVVDSIKQLKKPRPEFMVLAAIEDALKGVVS